MDVWRKYAIWSEQVCDHCEDPGHEAKNCQSLDKGTAGIHCKRCGHGDHVIKKCPFDKGAMPAEMIDRLTRSFRDKAVAPPPSPPRASTKLPDRTTTTKATSPNASPSTPPPTQTEEESFAAQKERWMAAELSLAKVPVKVLSKPSGGTSKVGVTGDDKNSCDVKANFFEIEIIPSSRKLLHKYGIVVEYRATSPPALAGPTAAPSGGDTTGLTRTATRRIKRELRRVLIKKFLMQAGLVGNWISDYDSTLVTVVPLSRQIREQTRSAYELWHNANSAAPPVRTEELFVSFSSAPNDPPVDFTDLIGYVEGKGEVKNFNEELKVLNVIALRNVYDKDYTGNVIGNKFYPESYAARKAKGEVNDNELYYINSGFFSSMRPGTGSILLNVNTVTSAFYVPKNLQVWISQYWKGTTPNSRNFQSTLKGVQVTLKLHDQTPQSRRWIVFDISPKNTQGTSFFDNDQNEVYIVDHMRKSWLPHSTRFD